MEERVVFNKDYCKSCSLCVHFCPVNIISIGKELNSRGYRAALVKEQEKCISCGKCAQICPDLVITVYRPEKRGKS